jgi:hypothetical protein
VLESNLTFPGTFYFFAAILVVSVPVVYFTVPETKDLGLEQGSILRNSISAKKNFG